jgi:hypothetical protein
MLIVLFWIFPFLQSSSNLLVNLRVIRLKLLFICLLIFTVKIWLLFITLSLIFNIKILLISILIWSFWKFSELISITCFPFLRTSLHNYLGYLIKCFFCIILFLILKELHFINESISANRLNFFCAPFQSFFNIFA